MKKNKEKLIKWLVNNSLTIIVSLAPTIGAVAAVIWKSISKSFSILDLIFMGIIIVESAFVIGFAIWRNCSYKSYHYPTLKIRPTYIVKDQVVDYKIKQRTRGKRTKKLHFSNTRTIRSRINLHTIPGRFFWTGNEKAGLPKKQLGYEFNPVENKGIWTFYEIHLRECLLKGREMEIKSEYPPIDDCTSSSPFVSVTTEEPTKKITFNLELGDSIVGDTITFEEYRANGSSIPINSEKINLDKNGSVTYVIDKPKRFRYYILSWVWKQ